MVTSLLLVVVLFSALGRTGNLEPVQNLFLIGSSPLSSGLSKGFKPLVGFFKDIGQADNLRKENTYLKQENEQLRNKNIHFSWGKDNVGFFPSEQVHALKFFYCW